MHKTSQNDPRRYNSLIRSRQCNVNLDVTLKGENTIITVNLEDFENEEILTAKTKIKHLRNIKFKNGRLVNLQKIEWDIAFINHNFAKVQDSINIEKYTEHCLRDIRNKIQSIMNKIHIPNIEHKITDKDTTLLFKIRNKDYDVQKQTINTDILIHDPKKFLSQITLGYDKNISENLLKK